MTFEMADPGSVAIDYLLRCGIEAAILVPLILLVQRFSGDRLSPTTKHALWIILLIRLSIPAFPESRLSLFNLADKMHREELSKNQIALADSPERVPRFQIRQELPNAIAESEPILSSALSEQTKTTSTTTSTPISIPTTNLSNKNLPPPSTENPLFVRPKTEQVAASSDSSTATIAWREWALAVWVGGVLLVSVRIARRSLIFRLELGLAKPLLAPDLLQNAENAKMELGIKKNIQIYQTNCVSSPAVYGLVSPKILLPKTFLHSRSNAELSHVLSHELAHIKRQDAIWNVWSTLVQIIHWPNPLVWYAIKRMRGDRELATDFLTLKRCTETEPIPYGETILKTLQTIPSQTLISGSIGFAEDRNSLVRRFDMISRFQRGRNYSQLLATIVVLLFGLTSLTSPTGRGKGNLQAAQPVGHTITVVVTDSSTKQPIPGVMVTSVFGPRVGDETRKTATAKTDRRGMAVLKLTNPPGPESWLAMNAIPINGYVSQVRIWRSSEDLWNQLPDRHEFQLDRGVEIGGTIVDENQIPLADVALELSGSSPSRNGDWSKQNVSRLFVPLELDIKTDDHGKWSCSVAPDSMTFVKLVLRKPNGAIHQCASPAQARGLLSHRNGAPISISSLQEQTSHIIFPEGTDIEVTVVDETGNPIEGTNIQELTGMIFLKLGSSLVTDQDGIARFEDRIGHEISYIATHPNYATAFQVAAPIDDETSVTIKLLPRTRLEGTIRDRSGKPIPNALVNLDTKTNEGFYLDWSVRSGPQGQFHWDNAPLSKRFYQVRVDGFIPQVIEASPKSGPISIILDNHVQATVTHTASVVNAETGQPIQEFSYLRGRNLPFSQVRPIKGSDGRITYTAPPDQIVDSKKPIQGEHYRIEIRAPGYKNTLSRAISIYEPNVDIQIKLQPNSKKHSYKNVVVLSPTGAPVEGAFVQLVGYESNTTSRLSNNWRTRARPTRWDSSFLISNAAGQLPAASIPLGFRGVSILDDRGSIAIPSKDLDLSNKTIQLLPLGKVEGVLKLNGIPKSGLRVDLRIVPKEEALLEGSIFKTSKRDGRFVFDHLPHGTYRLFRSNTAINSFVSPEYYAQNIRVQPGQTTTVDYHLEGQTVSGRFVTDPPRSDFDWQESDPWWMEGHYILRKITNGKNPLLLPPRRDQYVTEGRFSRSNNLYRRQFSARSKLNSYIYPLDVAPTGEFRAAFVPPGEYVLEANLVEMLGIERGTIQKRTLGTHSQRITIPVRNREGNLGTITIPITSTD